MAASKLSEEKISELNDAFKLIDTNGDGFINFNELKAMMISLGTNPTDAEIYAMINEVDINQDQKINFPEFLKMMSEHMKRNKNTVSNELLTCFKIFDADGDGQITHSEMKQALEKLGEPMTDLEIEEMIQAADMDGDGKVNYQEFAAVMIKKNPQQSS